MGRPLVQVLVLVDAEQSLLLMLLQVLVDAKQPVPDWLGGGGQPRGGYYA